MERHKTILGDFIYDASLSNTKSLLNEQIGLAVFLEVDSSGTSPWSWLSLDVILSLFLAWIFGGNFDLLGNKLQRSNSCLMIL